MPFKRNLQRYAAARAILQRATRVFVKRHVDAHLALARFEERNIIFGDFLKMGVEMEDRVYEVGRCRSNQVDP